MSLAQGKSAPPEGAGTGKGPVVAHIGLQPTRVRLARSQHWHGRVVGMNALDREHMRPDCLDQRHQRRCRGANPVGELSGIEIDAFVGIGCALAVERQMQAVVLFENSIRRDSRGKAESACVSVPRLN